MQSVTILHTGPGVSEVRRVPWRTRLTLAVVILIGLPLAPNSSAQQDEPPDVPPRRSDDVVKPTPEDWLESRGFEATDEGLKAAMRSDDLTAKRHAVRIARLDNNPSILIEAHQYLDELESIEPPAARTWMRARLGAARYLAHFEDPRGFEVLHNFAGVPPKEWGKVDAPPVLQAAAALAELGDETYIHQFQRVLERPDITGIPRLLSSFRSTHKPEVERAWLTAARRAKEALLERGPHDTAEWRAARARMNERIKRGQALGSESIHISPLRMNYVGPLAHCVSAQSIVTPKVLAAFEELATIDHPPTQQLREWMLEHWRSCELRGAPPE